MLLESVHAAMEGLLEATLRSRPRSVAVAEHDRTSLARSSLSVGRHGVQSVGTHGAIRGARWRLRASLHERAACHLDSHGHQLGSKVSQ